MKSVRFVHAADLHLDAAFAGIAQKAPSDIARKLHESTFAALDRLVDLCEREHPDFLLLAGDIYNAEDQSLHAQMALHDACLRLDQADIPVFIVHGNHDPLTSQLRSIHWSDNVTVFSENYASIPVYPANSRTEPIAIIHGISHATAREHKNLAALFHRSEEECLQIGLLHCAIDGSCKEQDRYAPCSLADLRQANMDYWALGHIHMQQKICDQPLIVYPGCTQGLHIDEEGEKGCFLVTATPDSTGGFSFNLEFQPLAPAVWCCADVSLDTMDAENANASAENIASEEDSDVTPDWIEDHLHNALQSLLNTAAPSTAMLLVRLKLHGHTRLDSFLRQESTYEDLLDRLRNQETDSSLRIWIKDLQILTQPLLDRKQMLERDDLLGGIFRMSESCRASPEKMKELCNEALKPLFANPRARKILAPLSEEESARLLAEAECLCADLLGND